MDSALDIKKYHATLNGASYINAKGRVTKVVGLVTEAHGPVSRLGGICDIYPKGGMPKIMAEVLGFNDNKVLLMPLGDTRGIGPGSRVVAKEQKAMIPVGPRLLGRVIDGLGSPIDGKGSIRGETEYPIYAEPLNPMARKRINRPLDTGVRAINGLLTVGCGQRIGIFSGSGVGKSVLLGMVARKTNADVNVIGLIGERGRELNEFIEKELGEEGLKRSVVVVSPSDYPPLIRMRGAFIASAIAEYYRDEGKDVILMMDSLTRFAMAQREVSLAAGEPPTAKGYTPSVFTSLPRLLERSGTSSNRGTITGLYTVLVEGDDMNEPVADTVRSILDGHIVLSRDLAMRNHYPAIDLLASISRVMRDITSPEHQRNAGWVKEIMATYKKAEDLINIGAYVSGSNPKIDYAIKMIDRVDEYLQQPVEETAKLEESTSRLEDLFQNPEKAGAKQSGGSEA